MKNKLAKILLAAGMILTLPATTLAAETETDSEGKIHFPIEREEVETPDFLVNGAIKDVTQKILPISVEARYFMPRMNMKVNSDKFSYNGGSIGTKDNLGFGNDKAPELIFRYNRFTADYFKVHGSGDTNISGSNYLTFNGKDYSGNVHSKNDLHYLKLQVTNPIVNVLGSGVDWSYGLTGLRWKGTVNGTESLTGNAISESKSFSGVIPTLGIGAHASLLDILIFRAHLSGMTFGGRGHLYDFEAGVRYNPLDLLSISVGYRKIHAKIKSSDDIGTLDINGPYAGLRFDF